MFLILFDVDGTLVDSQHLIVATMNRAFAGAGLAPPDAAATRSIIGLSLPQAMARLAADQDAATQAALVDAYKAHFSIERDSAPAPLYPGVAEGLARLAARDDVILGVATGKSRRGLDHLIAAHGWQGLFVTRQTADTNPSKPDPGMIRAALSETGTLPERTAMIGDTSYDMAMGRAAGVRALGVAWGYHDAAALTGAGAEAVAADFAALTARIEEMTA
ncbi:HAD-IA family hydrolase [Paracoccus sp. p4-l81]|uniref:HAD-IA family hydrolase n=1 Tax=unclassified Paracoccus (in: a-proteobacteria) TaxID=2688777 RepID=UPI0035B86695